MNKLSHGFVNCRYRPEDKKLVAAYINIFCKRAIGLQWGNFFVGVMIGHQNPPKLVVIEDSADEQAD